MQELLKSYHLVYLCYMFLYYTSRKTNIYAATHFSTAYDQEAIIPTYQMRKVRV